MRLAIHEFLDLHTFRKIPGLSFGFDIVRRNGSDTRSTGLQSERTNRALVDLVPQKAQKAFLMG